MRKAGLAVRPAQRPFKALACACLMFASPINAASADESEEIREALSAIQAKDQVLQDIGWRLVTGNASFCENRQSAIGLLLLDLASFRDPDPIRRALSMDGHFLIQTVAKQSPAQAGGLERNSEVTEIDQSQLSIMPAADDRDWRRQKAAHDKIDAALNESGEVSITLGDGRGFTIAGVPACATRFELEDSGKRAIADGSRVQIGAKFPGFNYPEEEFAAAIAHELAHNILQHRIWLVKVGRDRKNIRITEREADRLMPWLLANAGYEPSASLRFMQRWGPRHSGGLFRKRTHEGWDERIEHIEAELEAMQQHWNGQGPADWRQHFAREISAD